MSRARRRVKEVGSDRPAMPVGRWGLVAGLVALVLVLFWAWGPSAPDSEPAAAAVAPPSATDLPKLSAAAQGDTVDSLTLATAAAEARLQASLERLAREDHERAEAHAREQAAAERLRQQQADQARRREQTSVTARVEAVPASPTAVPASAAAAPTPQMPSDSRPAGLTVPTAAEPNVTRSVEQRCADSGNFFSRSLCHSRVCSDPALAQDPVCRRLRETAQANQKDPHLLN